MFTIYVHSVCNIGILKVILANPVVSKQTKKHFNFAYHVPNLTIEFFLSLGHLLTIQRIENISRKTALFQSLPISPLSSYPSTPAK